jgi:nucleoside-diphosphate-sugar epimerase
MRVVVIGATGHTGGYLVPRLVRAGHEVVAVSRGSSSLYREDDAWQGVERVSLDRGALEAQAKFGDAIAALSPDAVIDMICFSPESATQLLDALRGRIQHLLVCTSIWVKGRLAAVPALEDDDSEPWGEYGIGKAAIERVLRDESAKSGLRTTCLRPGHISGPGWPAINPVGNLDLGVWERLARGEPVAIPNFGLETLHHVHADDVAQAFERSIDRVAGDLAERYSVVSERAVTTRGLAESIARAFGATPNLTLMPFEQFRAQTEDELAATTYEHVARSHSMSIGKASTDFGYRPRYTSVQAIAESVNWLADNGLIDVGDRRLVV